MLRIVGIVVAVAANLGQASTLGCNANNCLRAVTGTAPHKVPAATRSADCSSFLKTTVYPETVTEYITVSETPGTITVTEIVATITDTVNIVATQSVTTTIETAYYRKAKRQAPAPSPGTVTPSSIPPYASPCIGGAAYSSACSCWGILGTISTAPVPVTTVTVTETAATPTATAIETAFATVTVSATTTVVVATALATTCPGSSGSPLLVGEGSNPCGCYYQTYCATKVVKVNPGIGEVNTVTSSARLCLNICDNYADCWYFNYDLATGKCNLIGADTNPQFIPNQEGWVSGRRTSITCSLDPQNCLEGSSGPNKRRDTIVEPSDDRPRLTSSG